MVVYEPITKVNLERITNGVFGFTMTLLAKDIVTPDQYEKAVSITVDQFFNNTLSSILDFIGVFILLAMFWMLFYQMFHRMKTYDYHFIHVHMLALMAIVLIPFSSQFSNLADNFTFADYFFQFNILMLGVILVYLWHYATSKPELLTPELTKADARFLFNKCLVPVAVAIIGVAWITADLEYTDITSFLPFIIFGIFFRNPPINEDNPTR
ncbi:MAG: DUF1211 domain-containing protein [Methanospirillum sp.]|uniref:TMEM175 family protein n=1 Tax=Methanospirillum sp. TaxID=45200 RepID=UPI00236F8999|nr:TMEM175 family protein [Methanospirillum sp.]MDD1728287.1 DUF1211 domain-containing protein [Methanospirillum sp.]